jgi:hypothetical protein
MQFFSDITSSHRLPRSPPRRPLFVHSRGPSAIPRQPVTSATRRERPACSPSPPTYHPLCTSPPLPSTPLLSLLWPITLLLSPIVFPSLRFKPSCQSPLPLFLASSPLFRPLCQSPLLPFHSILPITFHLFLASSPHLPITSSLHGPSAPRIFPLPSPRSITQSLAAGRSSSPKSRPSLIN